MVSPLVPEEKRATMVGWYDPGQLARTGADVAASTLFGRRADFRLIEAQGSIEAEEIDFGGGEFWFDYVADSGDGWNPTYAIAAAIAQPTLTLSDPDGKRQHVTHRGRLLVFGGDEVYPVASRQEYKERLVAPFAAALPLPVDPPPMVRAIPGNHDWYDSLVSFMRLFCARDTFANHWQAKQRRSYFAARLPQGWWLMCPDIQLDSDIDEPQIEYFKAIAAQMGPDDRVILCTAEPHWIYAWIYGEARPDLNEDNLAFLEQKIFGNRIAVFIAGDLHHYRRHATDDGTRHKITAGGGGAFLHPTHGPDTSTIDDGFVHKKSFPDAATSRKLCWGNLLFLLRNWKFGFVTGFAYMLTCWAALTDVSGYGIHQVGEALAEAINAAFNKQVAAFWYLALLGGFVLFTDTHSKAYRWVGGLAHALTHMLAAFFIGWGATVLSVHCCRFTFGDTGQLLIAGGVILALGFFVGPIIMGLYLLVSLNAFKRHSNEAFSSLKIEDWKNFLRLRIAPDGTLTIFPVGIRRVPRRWKEAVAPGGPLYTSDDSRSTPPELIESPIEIRRDDAGRRSSRAMP